MEVETVLRCAHTRLANRGSWTRGAFARALTEQPVMPLSDRAWRWSLTGAVALALLEVLGPTPSVYEWQRLYESAIDALWLALPDDHPRRVCMALDLDGFNDYPGTYHEDVLALVERSLLQMGSRAVTGPR